jgi:hypothetical protein
MSKTIWFLLFSALHGIMQLNGQTSIGKEEIPPFTINTLTDKGAWCWFADPRALHYENENGSINSSYIGYIDVDGFIKATQIDHLHKQTHEVMIRSWFQPDDHNNPTFLVLPDERIMIFYSRHTDEPCFYYRISQNPGDITTLGEEKRINTGHNTTYPSPFILSDDPEHIYLCWRGIGWHPTVARLTIPDEKDEVEFDWGPYQIIRSLKGVSGVRPYAKYASNGKNKIYVAYTSTHPDNQTVNWIYLNYIDINTKELKDIKGNQLSLLGESQLHDVDITDAYKDNYPLAVVDDSPLRNWIWELTLDKKENPVMATVGISHDKSSHDYYQIRWTGNEWQKTFLTNAGGHFHLSPDIEKCYSGGLAIDKLNPQIIYGSVPVEGKFGRIYELKKFIVSADGKSVTEEQLTFNSPKNNARPFDIAGGTTSPTLLWMQGDYYDWIVSAQRPMGYSTAIKTTMYIPKAEIDLGKGLVLDRIIGNMTTGKQTSFRTPKLENFSIALTLSPNRLDLQGVIIQINDLSYEVNKGDLPYPVLTSKGKQYVSSNVLGNSNAWKKQPRGTNGRWYTPETDDVYHLTVSYDGTILRTFINGLLDQSVPIKGLLLSEVTVGGFSGAVEKLLIYNRSLSQDEIKTLKKAQ